MTDPAALDLGLAPVEPRQADATARRSGARPPAPERSPLLGPRYRYGVVHRTQWRWISPPATADRWEDARDGLDRMRATLDDEGRGVTVEVHNSATLFVQTYDLVEQGWALAAVTVREDLPRAFVERD